jgi:hypothetical protein
LRAFTECKIVCSGESVFFKHWGVWSTSDLIVLKATYPISLSKSKARDRSGFFQTLLAHPGLIERLFHGIPQLTGTASELRRTASERHEKLHTLKKERLLVESLRRFCKQQVELPEKRYN